MPKEQEDHFKSEAADALARILAEQDEVIALMDQMKADGECTSTIFLNEFKEFVDLPLVRPSKLDGFSHHFI